MSLVHIGSCEPIGITGASNTPVLHYSNTPRDFNALLDFER